MCVWDTVAVTCEAKAAAGHAKLQIVDVMASCRSSRKKDADPSTLKRLFDALAVCALEAQWRFVVPVGGG